MQVIEDMYYSEYTKKILSEKVDGERSQGLVRASGLLWYKDD